MVLNHFNRIDLRAFFNFKICFIFPLAHVNLEQCFTMCIAQTAGTVSFVSFNSFSIEKWFVLRLLLIKGNEK